MIINIFGVLGWVFMVVVVVYVVFKYGLNGMVKLLCEELKCIEIWLFNLYLGGVDLEFWDDIDMFVNWDKFIMVQEVGCVVWFMCQ